MTFSLEFSSDRSDSASLVWVCTQSAKSVIESHQARTLIPLAVRNIVKCVHQRLLSRTVGASSQSSLPGQVRLREFGGLRSNRDRTILAVAVSNGARAAEMLGIRSVDLDWGDQLVRVIRKGTLGSTLWTILRSGGTAIGGRPVGRGGGACRSWSGPSVARHSSVLSETLCVGVMARVTVIERGEGPVGGRDAARGFEYQFLCTLEAALDALQHWGTDELTAVSVDPPPPDDPTADPDIVDFGLYDLRGCRIAAQVKQGSPTSQLSAADAVRILTRLVTHAADAHLLITNRRVGAGLCELVKGLNQAGTATEARQRVRAVLARAPRILEGLDGLDDAGWDRLRRARIVLDDRDADHVRVAVREKVRQVRHGLQPASVGWDAAGLLTGYLVAEVLARAASPEVHALSRDELVEALEIDRAMLTTLMRRRDWAVHINPAPRGTDIARPDLLAQIARSLPTPASTDDVPICVLKGLSGMGKTSLAAAWADDRADAYAAVFWVDATNIPQLERSFRSVRDWCRSEGLSVAEASGVRDEVHVSLANAARPWLMVFDNCVDLPQIRSWIPPRGRGHVLITTTDQRGLTGAHVSDIAVSGMTLDEATQLLARRMKVAADRRGSDWRSLRQLARMVHCWPLALELAAGYLLDCDAGLGGVADYERLLRALADDALVPVGYPRTLVAAIGLAWERMHQRARAGSNADGLATGVLRYAAYTSSRQIPLHLLLSCVLVDPRELVGEGARGGGLRRYQGSDPPVGEVVRALRRESLVTVDEPLFDSDAVGTAADITYTIAVNEIVQVIIRSHMAGEGSEYQAVTEAAFHLQYWLSYFVDADRMDIASAFSRHAIAVAEYALQAQICDHGVALLLGNTAKLLGQFEEWDAAARYLRAELTGLDALDAKPGDRTVWKLQAASALAGTLAQGADRLHTVEGEAVAALERVLREVTRAAELDPDITAQAVHSAHEVATAMIEHLSNHSRLAAIRSALADYRAMLPLSAEFQYLDQRRRINELLRHDGNDLAARDLIRSLLADPQLPSVHQPELMRLLLECQARRHEWADAQRIAARFLDAAQRGVLTRLDATLVVRNTGFACYPGILLGEPQARAVLHTVIQVAYAYEQGNNKPFQSGERDVIAVLRALDACLDHDVDGCRGWLSAINMADFRHADKGGFIEVLYQLLNAWASAMSGIGTWYPGWDGPTESTSTVTEAGRAFFVPPLPDEGRIAALVDAPTDLLPLLAVVMTYSARASTRPMRHPAAQARELSLALNILGFAAEVATSSLQALSEPGAGTWTTLVDVHYIVRADSFCRLIDPTFPYVRVSRGQSTITQDSVRALPLIATPHASDPIADVPTVVPTPFPARYQLREILDLVRIQDASSPGEMRDAAHEAFLVAAHVTAALNLLPADRRSRLLNHFPHLHTILVGQGGF